VADQSSIPATAVAEMFNKLRVLEADYFRYSDNEEILAKADSRPVDESKKKAWRVAAESLMAELDRIELHFADLGFNIPVDNNLTVGAEVRELFGEER
jgi:hypothetical protein